MPQKSARNAWREDVVLRHLLRRSVPDATWRWAEPQLDAMGMAVPARVDKLAATADRHPPVLHTHDRDGNRIDEIEYHPAYNSLGEIAYGSGLVSLKYDPVVRGAHPESLHAVAFGLGYLFAQAEAGLYAPVSMTDGVARIIERYGSEALRAHYLPKLASRNEGTLVTGAMFLAEKQAGSDIGKSATRAVPDGRGEFGEVWRLYGEKWFCSNVDAGLAVVLARPDGAVEGARGLALFLVPRPLPDGARNTGVIVERLKDKLGVRSMATGEVRFEGAVAFPLGDPRRGFRTMAEMVTLSRLYSAVAAAAALRRASVEARRYATARVTFNRHVSDHPLAAATLTELSAEAIGAAALVFAAVHALDRVDARGSEPDARLVRILVPLAKGYLAKRAVASLSEAMELCGGNGYVEERPLARLLRDTQVLPIWEGTTNVQVLDAFRAMTKEDAHAVLFEALRAAASGAGADNAAAKDVLATLQHLEATLPELAAAALRGQHLWRTWFERCAQATEVALCLREAQAPSVLPGDAGPQAAAAFAAAAERLARRHLRGARSVLFELGKPPADKALAV